MVQRTFSALNSGMRDYFGQSLWFYLYNHSHNYPELLTKKTL
jgi:hypothetical protein